ncbi:MAG: hypothetical protein C0412_20135, partial [Flavobacterium sp.]|nr:hypothetical protein [Flavobacterium sp.]
TFINMRKKITKNKYLFSFALIFLLSGLFFIIPHSANAGDWGLGFLFGSIGAYVLTGVGIFLYAAVSFLSSCLIVIIQILIAVSSYNDFINAPAIIEGWAIIRDVANMFFVIVLLIIAISTILGIETYNYKKLLPKLLLMAILINFSKMICGLFIDLSQVVMMTFVDGYKEAAAGNFATAFGLNDLLSFRWETLTGEKLEEQVKVGQLEIMGALLLAFVLVIVAISVTLGTILIFLIRIIMLWFLVVLSPLAYLLSAFPGGDKYAQQWWTEFTKYLIVGPAMAFFLWLSLMVMSTADVDKNIPYKGFEKSNSGGEQSTIVGALKKTGDVLAANDIYATISRVSSSSHLLSYIIAIGMLCGSMMVASQIGVAGAGMAMNLAKKSGKWMAMRPIKAGGWGARKLAAGKFGKWGEGIQLNPMVYWKAYKERKEDVKNQELMLGEAGGKKHLEAGGIRGFLLGGGATKDWMKKYQGALGIKAFFKVKEEHKMKSDKDKAIRAVESKKEEIAEKIKARPSDQKINENLVMKGLENGTDEEKAKATKEFIMDWRFNEAEKRPMKYNLRTEDLRHDFEEYDDLEKAEKAIKRPITEAYYARQAEDKLIREEQSLIKTEDEGKLANSFEAALGGGPDKLYQAAGILLRAFETGNENGILEGCDYKTDGKGMNDFFNEIMIGKLGMNKESAYDLQTTASSLAKRNGHFVVSETTEINKETGQIEQRSLKDQQEAVYCESKKVSTSSRWQQGSRFAISAETTDSKTGKRTTELTNFGKMNMAEDWRSIADFFSKSGMSSTIMKDLADPAKEHDLMEVLKMVEQETGKDGSKLKDDDKKKYNWFKTFISNRINEGKNPKRTKSLDERISALTSATIEEEAYTWEAPETPIEDKDDEDKKKKKKKEDEYKIEDDGSINLSGIPPSQTQSPTGGTGTPPVPPTPPQTPP